MRKIIGIVAEYNPFHRGHRYQLEEIKKRNGDAAIVSVLSSNFLQRGVPALLDKWERAHAAVRCGVDLALELPLPFCCNNAGVFAGGAVALLKAAGVVEAISFGMEDETDLLGAISAILVQEPPAFKAILQNFLKKGYSYAQARAEAADRFCPGGGALLGKPNNTLAVAYAEAALRQRAGFELLPVRRAGAGYNDRSEGEIMSATGIREALLNGRMESACRAMPDESAAILRKNIAAGRCCLDWEPLWQALRLLLMRATSAELARYAEVSEGVENRFLDQFPRCESFEELAERVATRRYPRTRVRRQLMSLLLNVSEADNQLFQRHGPAYIRPLAMNDRGRELLRLMRKKSSLPVITKPAGLHGDDYAQKIMALEFRGAALWESLVPRPDWEREKKAVPLILDD
ncbi:tRNA(Met) cytidine acetate ligase [Pyramidobacter porci]